jgi:hypothetical protein
LAEGCVASAKAFVDIAPKQHCCPRSAMIEGEALQEWFATPERRIIFDLNDFDETSPAPWEWDLKRLAASIVLAGRSVGLRNSNNRDCGRFVPGIPASPTNLLPPAESTTKSG